MKKGTFFFFFFWKNEPKNFTPNRYSILFLCVFHQNKALYNFCKRGQRSIVEPNIGLEYALLTILNIGFWYGSFVLKYWNDTLSISVLSNKNGYSSFLKKVVVYRKICFKVKVLIENVRNFHWSLKRRAILKIPITIFRKIYALSVGFKIKLLRKGFSQGKYKNMKDCFS